MDSPIVSVCIPTYNSSKFIRQCLKSILEQSTTDIEIIISDNASTDETLAIISEFSDRRIQIHRQASNIGPHRNFNFAISKAKGKFIKTFCSDDLMLPRLLEQQISALDRFPSVGVVSCHAIVEPDSGSRELWNVLEGYHIGKRAVEDCVAIMQNRIGNPSSFMFRRECLHGKGFDERLQFISDFYLPALIFRDGWDFYGLREPGFRYLRHPNADTFRTISSERHDWLKVINEFKVVSPPHLIQLLRQGLPAEAELLAAQMATAWIENTIPTRFLYHSLRHLQDHEAKSFIIAYLRNIPWTQRSWASLHAKTGHLLQKLRNFRP